MNRVLRFLGAVEDTILASVLGVMIVMAAIQIVLRNVFDTGLTWADPMLRVSVLWIGMLGAMAATRDDRQISVDALSRFLPSRWNARVRVLTDIFTTAVAGFFSWHAGRLVLEDYGSGMTAFSSVPVWVCELILPVAMAIISIRYAIYAWKHFREAREGGPPQRPQDPTNIGEGPAERPTSNVQRSTSKEDTPTNPHVRQEQPDQNDALGHPTFGVERSTFGVRRSTP